jgi:hypothetical protein
MIGKRAHQDAVDPAFGRPVHLRDQIDDAALGADVRRMSYVRQEQSAGLSGRLGGDADATI